MNHLLSGTPRGRVTTCGVFIASTLTKHLFFTCFGYHPGASQDAESSPLTGILVSWLMLEYWVAGPHSTCGTAPIMTGTFSCGTTQVQGQYVTIAGLVVLCPYVRNHAAEILSAFASEIPCCCQYSHTCMF